MAIPAFPAMKTDKDRIRELKDKITELYVGFSDNPAIHPKIIAKLATVLNDFDKFIVEYCRWR